MVISAPNNMHSDARKIHIASFVCGQAGGGLRMVGAVPLAMRDRDVGHRYASSADTDGSNAHP